MYSETFIKIYDNILSGKLSKYSKYNHPSIYIHVSTIISYIYGVGALSSRKVLQSVVYATIGILVFTAWNIVMQFCTRVFTYTVSTKPESSSGIDMKAIPVYTKQSIFLSSF